MSIKKLFILALVIFLISNAKAQEPLKLSFNHLAVSVKDLEKSEFFYKDIMMLSEIKNLSDIEGIRWFSLSGGRELHLIYSNDKNVTNKSTHIAFSTGSFDAMLKRMKEWKLPYSHFAGKPNAINIRADGIKQIYFQDPDGYWLDVNSVDDGLLKKQQSIRINESKQSFFKLNS